jgi:two-component system, OmpR family, sensor histidine kinase MtrB
MPRRGIAPGRLRRRLTIAFVLVAGLSAGALALGSFLLVRQTRLRDSLDRAKADAEFNLALAANLREDTDLQAFVSNYESRGVHAELVTGNSRFFSTRSFRPAVPASLQRLVGNGRLAYERATFEDTPYVIVGSRPSGSNVELYFFYREDGLNRDLTQLRNVLLVGWGAVIVLAALVGSVLARRTLEPVAKASQAARSMADGMLQTRLPVEAEDEFGAWAESFNEMAEALEAKINALSEAQARERRFTSDVAHELRTPLTALVGEASLLRELLDRIPEDARRPAELLIHDVARLRRLVEELMEISRFDAGGESVNVEPVDLAALVQATIRTRGWERRVGVRSQETVVDSDRRRLERIVANLIGNALEHGGANVQVLVGRSGGDAFVEVSDDGPGIDPEHLPHLFDRFYKADRSRSGRGSGLGLAIAIENARLLGGDIVVWSEPGLGSRFRLILPVTEPLRTSEPAVTPAPQDEAHSPSKGGQR